MTILSLLSGMDGEIPKNKNKQKRNGIRGSGGLRGISRIDEQEDDD